MLKYLEEVWRQDQIPVLAQRSGSKDLFVKLPNFENSLSWRWKNRRWLRELSPKGRKPKWSDKYQGWQIPKSWITRMTQHLLARYGECFVVQPYRSSKKCAPACMNAKGLDCDCSCMGEFHGTGGPSASWFVVSETFAISWDQTEFGCRYLTAP